MAAHEYDPDDNFDQAFHAQAGIDDEDALGPARLRKKPGRGRCVGWGFQTR